MARREMAAWHGGGGVKAVAKIINAANIKINNGGRRNEEAA